MRFEAKRDVMISLRAALILAVSLTTAGCYGLRASEQDIKEGLLERTPLGSERSEVEAVLAELAGREVQPAIPDPDFPSPGRPFEAKEWGASYQVSLGSYGWLQRVDVVAYYVLDRAGRLVEIVVQKQYDAP